MVIPSPQKRKVHRKVSFWTNAPHTFPIIGGSDNANGMPMGHRKPTGQQIRQSSKVNETYPQNKPKYLQYIHGFLWASCVCSMFLFPMFSPKLGIISSMFLQFSFRMPCFSWFSMVFHVYPMHFGPDLSPTGPMASAPSLEASWLVAQVQEAAQRRAWRGLCPWRRQDLRGAAMRCFAFSRSFRWMVI